MRNVIQPAISLHAKFQTATSEYYVGELDSLNWAQVSANDRFPSTTLAVIDDLRNLKCINLLKNQKLFHLDKSDPKPTTRELLNNFRVFMTISPALYLRRCTQGGNAISEPVLVCPQQVLVAWGSVDDILKFQARDYSAISVFSS
jgi:hypothetical protein